MSVNKSLFMCPGQGSQHIGMSKEFFEEPLVKDVFECANEALSLNLSDIMLNGDETRLTKTENAQPALLCASYVAYTYLERQSKKSLSDFCQYIAGHSLGEYSALVISGALSFEEGLRLVRLRGQAMQRAVPVGEGAMSAFIGLSAEESQHVCAESGAYIANDNSEGQIVISGALASVENAEKLAKEKGAKRAVRLPVSAPFHSPLMQPAAEEMKDALSSVNFKTPKVPVITNISAAPVTDAEVLKTQLVEQVTGQVRWRESMIFAANNGVENVYEVGCGKVLAGLAKRCDKRLKAVSLITPEQIDALLSV